MQVAETGTQISRRRSGNVQRTLARHRLSVLLMQTCERAEFLYEVNGPLLAIMQQDVPAIHRLQRSSQLTGQQSKEKQGKVIRHTNV